MKCEHILFNTHWNALSSKDDKLKSQVPVLLILLKLETDVFSQ